MVLFDLFRNNKMKISIPKVVEIYSPIDGIVIPLDEIPDAVYAGKNIGHGCGIEPTGDIIYCPIDGEIEIAGINNEVFIEAEGLEMIFHFGVADKYSLNSSLFVDREKEFIKEKGLTRLTESINCKKGEKLVKINKELIKEYFYSFKSPFIITNMEQVAFLKIMARGEIKAGDLLMRVILK